MCLPTLPTMLFSEFCFSYKGDVLVVLSLLQVPGYSRTFLLLCRHRHTEFNCVLNLKTQNNQRPVKSRSTSLLINLPAVK